MRTIRDILAGAVSGEEQGFSIIELLVALTLMAILGATLLGVIVSGSDAFERILAERDAQNEARVALSYVTVKMRQNMRADDISVIASDSLTNPGNVLKIGERVYAQAANNTVGVRNTSGGLLEPSLFIYFLKASDGGTGSLVEKKSNVPGVDDLSGASKIADISGFSVEYADEEGKQIRVSVESGDADNSILRETVITLR